MTGPPIGVWTTCPQCNTDTVAIIPVESGTIVEQTNDPDGKVRVNCNECGEQFFRYYRADD